MDKHKVFISYHHDNDQYYYNKLDALFGGDFFVNKSVKDGDIDDNMKTDTIRQKIRDEYLSDTTVTIVLIGAETWKRKYIDWEISSSIRDTEKNPRSGLIGIILPTYPRNDIQHYNKHTIPPRLADNIDCKFAKIYNWTENPIELMKWIEDAFQNRNNPNCLPDNSRSMFGKNRTGTEWSD